MAYASDFDLVSILSRELQLTEKSVRAVIALLEEGATVPFIARYRKEKTGGLDEVQIRDIQEKRSYFLELHERRQTILKAIDEQGKLTAALRAAIVAATTKSQLEDLYLPYKKKRRTRATIAREQGLLPLAEEILSQRLDGHPEQSAKRFVGTDPKLEDTKAVLKGALDIVAEVISEVLEIRNLVRQAFAKDGVLKVEAVEAKTQTRTKFEQYYEFAERAASIPSHRFLAIRRGEREGVLRANIEVDVTRLQGAIAHRLGHRTNSPFGELLEKGVLQALRRTLLPGVENDLRVDLKMRSDRDAVDVFADNLRNLLLTAPLGASAVIGIDPGLRTGCKCASVDLTGKFLGHVTIYPSRGESERHKAAATLSQFVKAQQPRAIAVGNGTGGRETEAFVRKVLKDQNLDSIIVISVNEAGASVYSASDIARTEFPELDLTIRGAISIARRLQDPLAELVKIDPKAIGVGQYQHDVHQPMLTRKLGEVVESCVNGVGVELNTASAPLLRHVAGIGPKLAERIVAHRETNGAFPTRKALLKVTGLGPKAYEQSAGFLRVRSSKHPLDASAVHPERYALVEAMAADLSIGLNGLIGNEQALRGLDLKKYVTEQVGEPTLRDIIKELEKPGRDPRATFEPPKFRDDVHELGDLKLGMSLEGVVTNVTNFGAFVDVGVHQDGLVHISQLADHFVKDPRDVVKVGDKIRVRVLEVDVERKRISLSAKKQADQDTSRTTRTANTKPQNTSRNQTKRGRSKPQGNQARPPRPRSDFEHRPFASLIKD